MSHWGLFINSFGKMLHPVLWVYGLLRNGSSALASFFVLAFVGGLLVSTLTSILATSVWTLAYRHWRADHLPAPLVDDFA